MATLAQLRDRVLAKTGQPNDGALDPALSAVVDESLNAALEALAIEAAWLPWRRELVYVVEPGMSYALANEALDEAGIISIHAEAAGRRYELQGGLRQAQLHAEAVGIPQRWAYAMGLGLESVTIVNGGASGAVAGDVVAVSSPALLGAPPALARIAAETAGAITAIEVLSSGFGLPADAQAVAVDVAGAELAAVLADRAAIRLDCPASQPITLTITYDQSVVRLSADADVCPIDAELVALVAAGMAADANDWPGKGTLEALAARRLAKLKARHMPRLSMSMVPKDRPRRVRG